jgi:hypothetical protein
MLVFGNQSTTIRVKRFRNRVCVVLSLFQSYLYDNNPNNNNNSNKNSSRLKGWIQIHLLEGYQLHHKDTPYEYLRDVCCVMEWTTLKATFTTSGGKSEDICPVWNVFQEFPVGHIEREYLTLTVMDQDPFAKEAFVGRAYICIDHYGDIEPKEYWIPIKCKEDTSCDNHAADISPVCGGWLRLWLTFKAILQVSILGKYFIDTPIAFPYYI